MKEIVIKIGREVSFCLMNKNWVQIMDLCWEKLNLEEEDGKIIV